MENKFEIFKNINILVLDDVSFYYSLIKDHLKILGFEGAVFKALGVLDGIEILKKHKDTNKEIDLILCDLYMPEYNGLDFIKTVRASKSFAKVPIMVFTAETEQGRIIEAIQAGANSYLLKPWEAIQLKEKLIESLTVIRHL
ncbi:MAG: response regulator [Bacteriovoracaceae bacterium]|nr:response regulator [Bacteriovoracaceae bacterium]